MSKHTSDNNYSSLVQRLCYTLTGKSKEHALRFYKSVLKKLQSSSSASSSDRDEVYITERIKKQLNETSGDREVRRFSELYMKLQGGSFLKNPQAMLSLLVNLSEQTENNESSLFVTPQVVRHTVYLPTPGPPHNVTVRKSLQVNSVPTSLSRLNTSLCSRNRILTTVSQCATPQHAASDLRHGTLGVSQYSTTPRVRNDMEPLEAELIQRAAVNRGACPKNSVPQSVLLQELVYAVQGIGGKVLNLDPVDLDFKVNPEVYLQSSTKLMVLRIAELGWLHNQLRRYVDECNAARAPGLLEKSLVTALRDELTEYYRLVALLTRKVQIQCDQEMDSPLSEESPALEGPHFTVHQMHVWFLDPFKRLRILLEVSGACRGRKGGALASCVFSYLQHGDPGVRNVVKHLLAAVCRPMYVMLSRWMLDGELEDPFQEFFIVANVDVKGDRLWHEKYCVQESLVPSFIPLAQARKILATGKSINFLHEVCQDHTPVKGRDMLRHALKCTNVEALWSSERDGDLQAMMGTAYLETSRRVLDVLNGPHKFLENLQALRRYLLLGQGDFIRHLMEIIDPELQKPASQLYPHNLSGVLETAIRATNAQFEDTDILQRLDVRLLEASPGDTGWDVFSLDYHVTGPIGTIFAPNAMSYLMLFNALWRAKRMEYILSVTWKQQITSTRMLRRLPELGPVLQRTHLLTAEMIHLVQQMQYYTLFEVLECSWHTLITQVQQAEALDDIIRAHNRFLTKVKAGALLDEDSQELSSQLRTVYDLILQLQSLEKSLHAKALDELHSRSEHDEKMVHRGDMGDYSTRLTEDEKDVHRRKEFIEVYLPYVHAQLRMLTKNYQDVVKKLLLLLASHPDVSLQLLSVRLDFNEHYMRSDSRLAVPYTYQHRRLSELGAARTGK